MRATGTGQLRCTASRKPFRTGRAIRGKELDARDRRDSLDQARAHLGDEQLERAYAQGMALSLEKALDLALPKAGPA